MDKLFAFSNAIVILPYYDDVAKVSQLMSSACKRSRETWLKYLSAFVDNLKPSGVLRPILEKDDFLEELEKSDRFEWFTSIPISYFYFTLKIDQMSRSFKFDNFLRYLEAQVSKTSKMPEDMKKLYTINPSCKLKINASKNLKKYIQIYDNLQKLGVRDEVLEVRFNKSEDDYIEPLFCPYFEKAQATIRFEEDKVFTKRYFVEY